jgi:hypothetical protein
VSAISSFNITSNSQTPQTAAMTSSKPFGTVPAGAKQQPKPFELHVEDQKIQDLKTLLKLSPIAKETYENLQDDGSHGKLGVSRKWIVDAKKYWEEDFDWYVFFSPSVLSYIDKFSGAKKNPLSTHSPPSRPTLPTIQATPLMFTSPRCSLKTRPPYQSLSSMAGRGRSSSSSHS